MNHIWHINHVFQVTRNWDTYYLYVLTCYPFWQAIRFRHIIHYSWLDIDVWLEKLFEEKNLPFANFFFSANFLCNVINCWQSDFWEFLLSATKWVFFWDTPSKRNGQRKLSRGKTKVAMKILGCTSTGILKLLSA